MVNRSLFDPPLPLVTQYVQKSTDHGRALDLGCGDGHNAIFLAESGYCVDAVDVCLEETMIHNMNMFLFVLPAYTAEHKLSIVTHHDWVEDFLQKQPPSTYDVVLATYVLFFPSGSESTLLWDVVFPQILKILKPGGRLICTMLRSKKNKYTEVEMLPKDMLAAMQDVTHFEKFWAESTSTVYYNPSRICDKVSDGSAGDYIYDHWELVVDKNKN